jgi:hypothetical protein
MTSPVHIMARVPCPECDFIKCMSLSHLYRLRLVCQFCGLLYGFQWVGISDRTQLRCMILGTCPHGREMYTEPIYMCSDCRSREAESSRFPLHKLPFSSGTHFKWEDKDDS